MITVNGEGKHCPRLLTVQFGKNFYAVEMDLSTQNGKHLLGNSIDEGRRPMCHEKLLFSRAKRKMINAIIRILSLLLLCYSGFSLSASIPTILPAEEGHFITIVDRDNTYFGALSNRVRFTGATSFTTNIRQTTLVYMSDGNDRRLPELNREASYNIEIWEDNPVVPSPYLGLRCWDYEYDCQSSIYKPNSTIILDKGFRVEINQETRVVNPRISQGYVNYLVSLPVGESYSTDINYCWSWNYSAAVKNDCKIDQSGPSGSNIWHKKTVTFKKQGQLRIDNSPVTVDLMIASNGDFWVLPGSPDCELISTSYRQGVVCLFVRHDLQLASPINLDVITLTPSVKDSRLSEVTTNDFQVSTDKFTWYAKDQQMPFSELKKSNSIYIFMSKNMLKKISTIAPPRNMKNMFSLVVKNVPYYDSGIYEIMGSADINFIDRKMSVAIREKDGLTHPIKSGTVGRDKIEFEYLITESATVPSESLEISVQQDRGSPYKRDCTFYPPNDTTPGMAVVIPASILFSDRVGSYKNVSEHVYCDGTPLDLRQYSLTETRQPLPWAEPGGMTGAARFYDISLLFDLRPKSVNQTVGGEQWEGDVYQSGTISVKSVWK